MPRRLWIVVALLLALTPFARAAEVRVNVSPRETSVGLPVAIEIVIENAETIEPPDLPEIPGATVMRVPGTRSFTSTQVINGRMTQRKTQTLTYRVTPRVPGTMTIPSFAIVVDGLTYQTDVTEVVVTEVNDRAGFDDDVELLAAEIVTDRERIVLGEPLDLTLRIWMRPYRDERYEILLNERDMWSLVDGQSAWGSFTSTKQDLAARREMPRVLEQLRPGADGHRRAYYVYELPVRIWPRQSGPLALDPVTIVMDYPLRLERRRRVFSNDGLRVAQARQLVVQADPPDVVVTAPPEDDRPESFAGAVGVYGITATAKPADVAVGDPITLTLTIVDRTPGGSELDLLQPPRLGAASELTDDFRVPTDPLAGVVDGRTKTFTQTLRARHDDVDAIPAIPFSFFRTDTETYDTVWTRPIPISVRPASEMSMTEVVEAGGDARTATTELTVSAGGLLANYSEHDRLLASQSLELGWRAWLLLALPPLLFATAAVSQRRMTRLRHDSAYARRRTARRNAMAAIRAASASSNDTAARAERLAAAMRGYVADRCNLPSGGVTRTEVVQRLRATSIDAELVEQIEHVLSRCEACTYAGSADGDFDELTHQTERAIDRLERERLS